MWKNVLILLLASALTGLLFIHFTEKPQHSIASPPSAPPAQSQASPAPPQQTQTLPTPPDPAPAPPQPPKPPSHPIAVLLQEARANPALAGAAVGFSLLNSKGEVVLDENATTAFIPASSLKTLTTATALEILGPDFHFTTELKSTTPIQSGILKGDLILVGGGDPMLKLDDLKAMAAELKTRGLMRVTGGVRADTTFFPGSLYGDFWNWGDIGNGYGSGVAGLNLNHNRYVVAFTAGPEVGSPAQILGINLEVPGAIWNNEVTTGPEDSGDGAVIHGGEKTSEIFLRGTVPLGATKFKVQGAVPDPARFAAHHLRAILIAAGIQVGDHPGTAPATRSLLKHDSPPLLKIITSIHATSDNHETECVFRMLGIKAAKPSAEVILEHWKTRGLDFTGLRMVDGCGLARADFTRPLDLARLQFFAGTGPQGPAYKASLLAKDGLIWKGGAMSGIRTFTGYAQSKSGEEYCYALMINHYTDGAVVSELSQAVMDAMMEQ
ncbi:D-alanyl-D-alanine carboxypeptidase/D-alanyl-D-alanine-endopeptidase [Prosthecobacter sp.]|uniref:D-alanyl-D-alanine carboxypeptidase/D-alanyl-D-alanine endopeptidase n=1 Tax=Prosthecobacter sp. TaxID=1965333 RepID=UPI0037842364